MADKRDQGKIARLLGLIGPGPVAFYLDAVHLLSGDVETQSVTHLVGHLMREVNSAVLSVILPFSEISVVPEDIADLQREIATLLESRNVSETARKACLEGLQRSTNTEQVEAASRALGVSEEHEITKKWKHVSKRLHGTAHRPALEPPRPASEKFEALWYDFESVLLFVLDRFEASFLQTEKVLNDLLSIEGPDQADVKRLKNEVPNALPARQYFFERAAPIWLHPLKKGGLFTAPPEPEPSPEGEGYRFPPWPQSRYLARIASECPDTVRDVILDLPQTQNVYVHHDLLEAALAMPPGVAAPLVTKAKEWIRNSFEPIRPEQYGALVRHLADCDLGAALDLAGAVLEVFPKPLSASQTRFKRPPDVRGHVDPWDYWEILRHLVPVLTTAAREKALDLLCDLLRGAVEITLKDEDKNGVEDHSYGWRQDIRHEIGTDEDDVRSLLASAVRDTALTLISGSADNPAWVYRIVSILDSRRYYVFRRISLHILATAPVVPSDLIVERLGNRDLFQSRCVRAEYDWLAEAQFANLTLADKENVLKVLSDWPDVGAIKTNQETWFGKPVSDKEARKLARRYRLERLAPFSKALPSTWKEEYDHLVTEFGKPESGAVNPVRAAVWVGEIESEGKLLLRGKSPQEVALLLRGYKSKVEQKLPQMGDLSWHLEALVHSEAPGYSANALAFEDLEPPFILALLGGLHGALLAKTPIEWKPVLHLCQDLTALRSEPVEQGTEGNEAEGEISFETRLAMVRLLSDGLRAGVGEIPFEFRQDVWRIVRLLSDDRHPTPEEEHRLRFSQREFKSPVLEQFGQQPTGSLEELLHLQSSVVRPSALRGVIAYALWFKRGTGGQKSPQTLEQLPEVREVLELHLDPSRDPSLIERSVYGELFPCLVTIDSQWAAEHANKVFPLGDDSVDYWHAAWIPYLLQNPVYDDTFDVLMDQYRHAIDRIGVVPSEDSSRPGAHPDERLATHLMESYGRGWIQGGDELLDKFFRNSSDSLRGFAMRFVGRGLKETEGDVSTDILSRLQRLWESRVQVVSQTAGEAYQEEMRAFAWWFISGKFDEAWSMEHLVQAMTFAGGFGQANRLVVAQLAKIAPRMPDESAEYLEKIVGSDEQSRVGAGGNENVRTILTLALRSPNATSQSRAREVISRLSSRGQRDFESLLYDIDRHGAESSSAD